MYKRLVMDSSQLLGLTTFAYLFSAVLYIALFVFRKQQLGAIATGATICAFVINTAGIGMRWLESHQMGIGYAPLSNMYESLVFFAWSIAIFYLGLELKYKNRFLGTFAMPFAALAMILAEMKNPAISPLVPALQSNWLIAHVVTCFIGYAAFAIACGFGILYLVKNKKEPENEGKYLSQLPPLRILSDIVRQILVFGFIWLSAGIITGAIWANEAGNILELGPERDMVPYYLVYLRRSDSFPFHQGLGRDEIGMVLHCRLCLGHVHLLRCQLCPEWSAQLRIIDIGTATVLCKP